jgi:hypothetical protein
MALHEQLHGLYLTAKIIIITITILDIIHRPVFYLRTRRFGDWILSPSSGGTHCGETLEKELVFVSGDRD